MIATIRTVLFGAIASAFALPCAAQTATEISSWFSPIGAVGDEFTPGDPVVEVGPDPGQTHSLYLWVRNDRVLRSLAYDLEVGTPGVIEFTGVEVFNPDLIAEGMDFGDRWNFPTQPGTFSSDGQQITLIAAVNVDAEGLDPATRQFDMLYDVAADAAIFARIDYRAIGIGSTMLVLDVPPPGITENPPQPRYTLGSATITVAIPEPTSGLLFLVGCFSAAIWGRRRLPPR